MADHWDERTLRARAVDPGRRQRQEGAAPDAAEVEAYATVAEEGLHGVDGVHGPPLALILGMTPELRRMAHGLGFAVTCVDHSPRAIEFWRDWVDPEHAAVETIVEDDWLHLDRHVDRPAATVLGDGSFAMLTEPGACGHMLTTVRRVLDPAGTMAIRAPVVPSDFDPDEWRADVQLARHRSGETTLAELSLGLRLFGLFDEAYDPDTWLLHNDVVVDTYEDWQADGRFRAEEWAALSRQHYRGTILIPPQEAWGAVLADAGFAFDRVELEGRQWYRYYAVYGCRLT